MIIFLSDKLRQRKQQTEDGLGPMGRFGKRKAGLEKFFLTNPPFLWYITTVMEARAFFLCCKIFYF